MRWWPVPAALILAGLALLAAMAWSARGVPVVRRVAVALPGWPAGAGPVRVVLWSDLHLGNAATDAERLARIADQVSGLRPDLVVLAGDFVTDTAAVAGGLTAPLKRVRARFGVVAVLGNHDHWTDGVVVRRALEAAGVRVLSNEAVRAGPLAVGGLGDVVTRHADLGATLSAMARVGGAPVLLSHTPEVAGAFRGLVVAGHTHCGQVVLPFIGPPVEVTDERWRCGVVRDGARVTIVTAGTGTSVLPLRLGAPPDLWVVTLGVRAG